MGASQSSGIGRYHPARSGSLWKGRTNSILVVERIAKEGLVFIAALTPQWMRKPCSTWERMIVSLLGVWAFWCGDHFTPLGQPLYTGLWTALRRHPLSSRPSATRQIREQGVLRALDPDSESETEVVLNPCQASELFVAPHAL